MPSNENVAVLGKGKSLLHANNFIADCKYVIIINNFNKELPVMGECWRNCHTFCKPIANSGFEKRFL